MVVDTSALAAILTGAPERDAFEDLILATHPVMTSAASLVEVAILLRARRRDHAPEVLGELLSQLRIEVRAFDAGQAAHAQDAFQRYGIGRHPAALNFGDCLAYGLAKSQNDVLLFSGDRFVQTDIVPAWRGEADALAQAAEETEGAW